MSFRQFGGLQYAARNNIVSSNYNTNNNLQVTGNVGQPNSYINFQSDISGNIIVNGDFDLSGNLNVKGNELIEGNVNINGTTYIQQHLNVTGNEVVAGNIDVSGNTNIDGNLYVSGYTNDIINNPGFTNLPIDISGNFATQCTEWSSTQVEGQVVAVAMSASGQYQTAITLSSPYSYVGIYLSTNFGSSWSISITSTQNWSSVAISASGQYQTAVVNGGSIYVSTNFGAIWNPISDTSNNWVSVAISASGQYQTAVVNDGSIYLSTNYGATWNPGIGTSNLNWSSVAISASGQYQTAVTDTNPYTSGYIYVSTNFGASWNLISDTSNNWVSVAISASGQYQTAVTGLNYNTNPYTPGYIYVSTNFGASWNLTNSNSSSIVPDLISVAMSASGQYQIVLTNNVNNNSIFYSTNYGVSWTFNNITVPLNLLTWKSVAISASGQYANIAASAYGGNQGGIYTSTSPISFGNTSYFYFPAGVQYSSSASSNLGLTPVTNGNYLLISSSSSIKTKQNIVPLPDNRYNIQNFMKIQPIQYTPKEGFGDINHKNIGFIAEELHEIGLSELVAYNRNNECVSLFYDRFTSFIVKIAQDQQKKIEELEERINKLESKG
jgi:cytoskeletal protein CcmA (bactofilin family)/uncharacterized protein (DUF736 family)